MPKAPEQIELDQAWIGAEELPVHFANAFTGTPGPNAIFLNIGSQVPPEITSQDDLERLREKGYIPVKPIVRIALSPGGLDELIEALKTVRSNHRKLVKELEGPQS
ncbi:MAG TPA: hypothetical protein VNS60_10315 [Solirubrobacterales bacterium]|jgi:hypothetical protein|nr:hypothetical protein [Solirubrobacterales bacterium]